MEELDPKKFHVLDSKTKWKYIFITLVVSLFVLPFAFYKYYVLAINRPSQSGKEITFEIKRGDGVSEISDSLYEKGSINSSVLFKAYLIVNKLHTNVQAGVYKIPAGSNVIQISSMFQKGTNDIKVTFLEGWRVEEFAREAGKRFEKIDYEKFVSLAKNDEGYLFPDTYFFNVDVSEESLLNALKANFISKTKDILTDLALTKADLTKSEAIILASIVEREVSKEDDRPIVAGILISRYKNGIKLDADATVQYAVSGNGNYSPTAKNLNEFNWWALNLSNNDLLSDSPYNTRKNIGLPPAPISNPGLSVIKSVLNYKTSLYNYYLTDKKGVTHFAKTLEEHNDNVRKYL